MADSDVENLGVGYIDLPTSRSDQRRYITVRVLIRDIRPLHPWGGGPKQALIEPVEGGGRAWVMLRRIRRTA